MPLLSRKVSVSSIATILFIAICRCCYRYRHRETNPVLVLLFRLRLSLCLLLVLRPLPHDHAHQPHLSPNDDVPGQAAVQMCGQMWPDSVPRFDEPEICRRGRSGSCSNRGGGRPKSSYPRFTERRYLLLTLRKI